jgi:hypothetical protein
MHKDKCMNLKSLYSLLHVFSIPRFHRSEFYFHEIVIRFIHKRKDHYTHVNTHIKKIGIHEYDKITPMPKKTKHLCKHANLNLTTHSITFSYASII